MILYIVVAILAILDVVESIAFANIIKHQNREHGRREDTLINQICHLSGKTWAPPPVSDSPSQKEDFDYDRYTYSLDTVPDEG